MRLLHIRQRTYRDSADVGDDMTVTVAVTDGNPVRYRSAAGKDAPRSEGRIPCAGFLGMFFCCIYNIHATYRLLMRIKG